MNALLPKREVIIQSRRSGGEWRDSLDFEPVYLAVEMSTRGLVVDVFDSFLMVLIDNLIAAEDREWEHRLVWSDGEADVMGCCPLCDSVFPVSEGAPGDEYNEGVNAITCGCWDG